MSSFVFSTLKFQFVCIWCCSEIWVQAGSDLVYMWQDWMAWLLATGCFSSIRELGLMCQIEMVSVCVKMGYFTFAQKLFDKMPHKTLLHGT